jgi:3-hydroxybutyrate dehydrogenase
LAAGHSPATADAALIAKAAAANPASAPRCSREVHLVLPFMIVSPMLSCSWAKLPRSLLSSQKLAEPFSAPAAGALVLMSLASPQTYGELARQPRKFHDGFATSRSQRQKSSWRHTVRKQKTALVTGSTSGIGLGIAEALARNGANLVINGLGQPDEIERLRARLAAEHHVKVIFSPADMSQPDSIEAMMKLANDELGGVDILVNNAGIQHVAPVDEFPVDKWNAIVAINLNAAFHTTRLALRHMKQEQWGRIVNIASAHALVASPFKSAYVAAKHAIAGLTKTVALEVAEVGITVNAVCPGYVLTPLVEKQIPATAKARGITEDEVRRDVLLASQPTKKFVSVEQVAGLVEFLCSSSADSITGAVLPIEGGWTAH